MSKNNPTEDLTLEEITKVILKGEGETVEFKESYNVHFAKYCNTVAAFANTKGGYIFFGVRDDGQIIGVSENEKQRKNIINFILGNVKPDISIEPYIIKTTTGEYLFVLKVLPDLLTLHTSGDVPYKRIDSQNKAMEPTEIEKYIHNVSKLRMEGYKKETKSTKHISVSNIKKKGSLNEISTILFKIRPYLNRLGYETEKDLDFGEPTIKDGQLMGFTDIRVKHNNKPAFVIEVKRDSAKIKQEHIEQGLRYGRALDLPFIAITNGLEFQLFNTKTGNRLSINDHTFNVVPFKKDLELVLDYLKRNPQKDNIQITDRPQIYKKGVNKNELIKIFKKCHNAIRDIEKDDEHAFSDFSKILFLKLLEEKSEVEANEPYGTKLPRGWYFFDELKNNPRADQVMQSIKQMFSSIKVDPKYGDIFHGDDFYADNEDTYKYLVDNLADISFQDSEVDAKGSAFEYFCKFNLKGSKLGQYFTPREIVNLMVDMVDLKPLIFSLSDNSNHPKVIDPSCGTGGFLIQGMQRLLEEVKKLNLFKDREETLTDRVKKDVFWGCDANPTIARTAKMNMVIAGDGSSNIKKGNSLTEEIDFLKIGDDKQKADYILANPPFGMSENRLSGDVMRLYDVPTTKGQALFIQKMIKLTKSSGKICTIVDEGILNNPTMEDIRKYILKTCYIDAIVSLPMVTFKPNYTNVKTSFLLLTKKNSELERQSYPIFVCELKKVGYDSVYKPLKPTSGEINEEVINEFKNFQTDNVRYKGPFKDADFKTFIEDEIKTCFSLTVDEIEKNYKFRMDARFNNPHIVKKIRELKDLGALPISDLIRQPIVRGNGPDNSEEGIPVLKVRNITRMGIDWNTDFVTEEFYERASKLGKIALKNDVLVASTGVGSLGKVGYIDSDLKCTIDGHVSVLRIDTDKINPSYLTAFLLSKHGQVQFERLYSGSTGQIEIYSDDISQILVLVLSKDKQKKVIDNLSKNKRLIDDLKRNLQLLQEKSIKDFESLVLNKRN